MILGVLEDLLDRPTGQKVAAIGGIVVALAVIDWQYFYGPRQRDLADLTTQITERRADLENKRDKTNARAQAEREVRDLVAELKRAEARLPDQREIADLI